MDSRYLVNSSLGVAAVVDTLCASGAFKAAGLPTTRLRPTTTARLPERGMLSEEPAVDEPVDAGNDGEVIGEADGVILT